MATFPGLPASTSSTAVSGSARTSLATRSAASVRCPAFYPPKLQRRRASRSNLPTGRQVDPRLLVGRKIRAIQHYWIALFFFEISAKTSRRRRRRDGNSSGSPADKKRQRLFLYGKKERSCSGKNVIKREGLRQSSPIYNTGRKKRG